MSEKKKVAIVNLITGTRFLGTLLLPLIVSTFGPLGNAIYIGSLWLTDLIDGNLARHWEVSTIFGASFDALCDKIFGIATLAYLYIFYPFVLIPIIAELSIITVNWYYGSRGSDVKTSVIGKIKAGVLYSSIVLSILSTISLTSSLAHIIPTVITLTSAFQVATLGNYIIKNKKYLKENKPKNNVSKLGFFETIKEISRLLKDKKLYSPAYFKEHQNEPLLDKLYANEEIKKKEEVEENNDIENPVKPKSFTIEEKNNLKITFHLLDKEIEILEKNAIKNEVSYQELYDWLERSSFFKNKEESLSENKQNQTKLKKNHKIVDKT